MICLTCTTVFPFLCKIKIHCSSIVLQSNLLEPTYIQEGYAKYYNKAMIEEIDCNDTDVIGSQRVTFNNVIKIFKLMKYLS